MLVHAVVAEHHAAKVTTGEVFLTATKPANFFFLNLNHLFSETTSYRLCPLMGLPRIKQPMQCASRRLALALLLNAPWKVSVRPRLGGCRRATGHPYIVADIEPREIEKKREADPQSNHEHDSCNVRFHLNRSKLRPPAIQACPKLKGPYHPRA